MKTKEEILELIEEEDVQFIRLQFTDMFGNLKNLAITPGQLERVLDHKYVFDGGTMLGTMKYEEEELYLLPDLSTFVILPWRPQQGKVARLLCDVYREDGTEYELSSRTILKNIIREAKEKGYTFYVDPECEFFLFHTDENGIASTLTHEQAGYMDVGPLDLGENARRDIVLTLEEMGFEIESSHHETAPAQHEIDFKEEEPLQIADSIVTFRSAVRSTAKRFGLHATFMPKPKYGVAGSGMHFNVSMYKDGRNIFNNDSDEVRQEALWFMGGILAHAKGICTVTNPLVNSYKRLKGGFMAPTTIGWSKKNMNTFLKVRRRRGEDTKVELRFPDSAANPYLAIAICLKAGMEGVEKQINPGKETTKEDIFGHVEEQLPETLFDAITYTQKDPFVEQVLGSDFVRIYTDAKMDEWKEYVEQVTDWELNKYLHRM